MSKAPASVDPSPPDANDNVQQQLYELVCKEQGISGVFIRHIQGDAASPVTIEAALKNTVVHTAIVLGTQAFPGDATKQINIPPKSRDTRVLLHHKLLLRKVCTKIGNQSRKCCYARGGRKPGGYDDTACPGASTERRGRRRIQRA